VESSKLTLKTSKIQPCVAVVVRIMQGILKQTVPVKEGSKQDFQQCHSSVFLGSSKRTTCIEKDRNKILKQPQSC
jgi:hypothetical protein